MNQNRPFYATNTNLYDEFFRSSAPTTLNGENVILSQEQQRRVFDTLNTSIVGNPFGIPGNQQMLCAQRQYFPGGVLFTFPPSQIAQPQNMTHGPCCKCPPQPPPPSDYTYFHQAPAPVNTFFPSSMEYQQLKGSGGFGYQQPMPTEPFRLTFHHDYGTSCSDLLSHFSQIPPSTGLPDLSNLSGILQQQQQNIPKDCQTSPDQFFPSPPIEFSSNAKKLVLSKSTPEPSGHVVDVLNEDANDETCKKKVSFLDSDNVASTGDKSSQMTSDCICDAKKCKNKSKPDKKQQDDKRKQEKEKKKGKNQSNTSSSETTQSSDCEGDSDSQKYKKKKWRGYRKKSDLGSSDSQSSESADDNSDFENCKKCKRKKCKNRKDMTERDVSGSGSQTDTSNPPDYPPEKGHME